MNPDGRLMSPDRCRLMLTNPDGQDHPAHYHADKSQRRMHASRLLCGLARLYEYNACFRPVRASTRAARTLARCAASRRTARRLFARRRAAAPRRAVATCNHTCTRMYIGICAYDVQYIYAHVRVVHANACACVVTRATYTQHTTHMPHTNTTRMNACAHPFHSSASSAAALAQ